MILEYVKVSILRENTMKNLLLGIIAINLTFISANLALRSVEPTQAESQRSEYALKRFIEENCWVELNAIKKMLVGMNGLILRVIKMMGINTSPNQLKEN